MKRLRARLRNAFLIVPLVLGAALAQPASAQSEPTGFDYYVLALSWSPEHCARGDQAGDEPQCTGPRRHGFVVHGLWPQFHGGGYPSDCPVRRSLPHNVVEAMLEIMPSEGLIRHQWRKHGSCSGLVPEFYFGTIRRLWRALVLPENYREPATAFRASPETLRQSFIAANPGLTPGAIAVACRGQYLREVRICYGKDDAPVPCGREVARDQCRPGAFVVRPVREIGTRPALRGPDTPL